MATQIVPDDIYQDEDDPSYFEIQVWVVSVTDGDTIHVVPEGETEPMKVRLAGIDAPEKDQPYGTESTALLESLALGKQLTLAVICTNRNPGCPGGDECECTDFYGRRVGVLYESTWRHSINKELVEHGLAYNWRSYGMLYGGNRAQRRDREKRIGVWQRHGGEVRPWSHRHGGTQTPLEYMQEREAERGRNRADANQLADEVERLRQMLFDAGLGDEAEAV